MFGAPVKSSLPDGTVVFSVDVSVTPIGAEIEYTSEGLHYAKDVQSRFRGLQSLVLSELAKEKSLFKNPPTLASLEAITPNWGFVASEGKMVFSPYAKLERVNIAPDLLPCLVDIQLKGLEITRSTVRPRFILHYLGKKNSEIDFDWPAPVPPADLTEVSDVPFAEEGAHVVALADPAIKARQKAEAKAQIRTAFEAAKAARASAQALADTFYEAYDLSDAESAFTEWMSDEDSGSDSE
jgi:hypothetical protein